MGKVLLCFIVLCLSVPEMVHANSSCATDRPDLERISKLNLSQYQIHLTRSGDLPIFISRYRGALDDTISGSDASYVVAKVKREFFSFLNADFEVVKNKSFDRIKKSSQAFSEEELAKLFENLNQRFPHVIHVVFAPLSKSVCGLTLLPPHAQQGIAISTAEGCNMPIAFAHEGGHYLQLKHTFEDGPQKATLPLRENDCRYSDDGLCSTPFDPGLGYHNVNQQCEYTGRDGHHPDTGNIMSYSHCASHFNPDQELAMQNAYDLLVKPYERKLKIEIDDAPEWGNPGDPISIKYSTEGIALVQGYIVDAKHRPVAYLGTHRPSHNGEDESKGEITWKLPLTIKEGYYRIVLKDGMGGPSAIQDFEVDG